MKYNKMKSVVVVVVDVDFIVFHVFQIFVINVQNVLRSLVSTQLRPLEKTESSLVTMAIQLYSITVYVTYNTVLLTLIFIFVNIFV